MEYRLQLTACVCINEFNLIDSVMHLLMLVVVVGWFVN